jgi:hypothetical protein
LATTSYQPRPTLGTLELLQRTMPARMLRTSLSAGLCRAVTLNCSPYACGNQSSKYPPNLYPNTSSLQRLLRWQQVRRLHGSRGLGWMHLLHRRCAVAPCALPPVLDLPTTLPHSSSTGFYLYGCGPYAVAPIVGPLTACVHYPVRQALKKQYGITDDDPVMCQICCETCMMVQEIKEIELRRMAESTVVVAPEMSPMTGVEQSPQNVQPVQSTALEIPTPQMQCNAPPKQA